MIDVLVTDLVTADNAEKATRFDSEICNRPSAKDVVRGRGVEATYNIISNDRCSASRLVRSGVRALTVGGNLFGKAEGISSMSVGR